MRDGFILHEKTMEQLALLTDEEAGQLLKAMAAHYKGEGRPVVDRTVELVLINAEDRMDADEEFYESRRESGKKGASKRWQTDGKAMANDGKAIANAWQDDSKPMPSVSDSVSDTDSKKEKDKKRERRFTPPSLSEIKEYCQQRASDSHPAVNPEKFRDYYEANGWKVGKNPMKDWKAAVRTWEQREKNPAREPPKKQKSEYFNFNQRQYDYAALEKAIGR